MHVDNINIITVVHARYNYIILYACIAGVPYDGEPVLEVTTVHPVLMALVVTLTTAGATFAIACMIFNFICRNSRLVES